MPIWLRVWTVATVVATAVLLLLGTVVSSFRVGMADPIWPTEPWYLLGIDWSEPSPGFLIEHVHRLAGFTVGGLMSVLTLGLWLSERRPVVRWGGFAAIAGLLAAFGHLHGTLIRQARTTSPGEPLTVLAGVWIEIGLALALVAGFTLMTLFADRGRLRALAVGLLLAVMVQGLIGGLRVHLNALMGVTLSIVHGSFAQLVFAALVAIAVLVVGREPAAVHPEVRPLYDTARWWAFAAAVALYLQVVGGAVLRHTALAIGPRFHILLAFVAVIAVVYSVRSLTEIRRFRGSVVTLSILTLTQLALGVEAWLARFGDGLAGSLTRRVTAHDAGVRSLHAAVGYALFSLAVMLVVRLRPAASTAGQPQPSPALEVVA